MGKYEWLVPPMRYFSKLRGGSEAATFAHTNMARLEDLGVVGEIGVEWYSNAEPSCD